MLVYPNQGLQSVFSERFDTPIVLIVDTVVVQVRDDDGSGLIRGRQWQLY